MRPGTPRAPSFSVITVSNLGSEETRTNLLNVDPITGKTLAQLLIESLESRDSPGEKVRHESVRREDERKHKSDRDWKYLAVRETAQKILSGDADVWRSFSETFLLLGWDVKRSGDFRQLFEIHENGQVSPICMILPRSARPDKRAFRELCQLQTRYWHLQEEEPKAMMFFGPTYNQSNRTLMKPDYVEFAVRRGINLLPYETVICLSINHLINSKPSEELLAVLINNCGLTRYPVFDFSRVPLTNRQQLDALAEQLSDRWNASRKTI
jgi:hypothetical protein